MKCSGFTVRAMHNVNEVDVCACSFVSMGERRLLRQAALVAGEEGSRCDALLRA